MKKTSITKTCEYCGKAFEIPPYRVKQGTGKYCGMTCYHAARWGHTGTCHNCGKPADTKFCTPECQKDYWNKHGHELQKKRRIWERKVELIQKLGGKCAHCGNDDIRVLDIHHIDPSRKLTPKKRQYNWTRRFKDWETNMDNIEVLCANCHRIHTWQQMGYGVVNGKSI